MEEEYGGSYITTLPYVDVYPPGNPSYYSIGATGSSAPGQTLVTSVGATDSGDQAPHHEHTPHGHNLGNASGEPYPNYPYGAIPPQPWGPHFEDRLAAACAKPAGQSGRTFPLAGKML